VTRGTLVAPALTVGAVEETRRKGEGGSFGRESWTWSGAETAGSCARSAS